MFHRSSELAYAARPNNDDKRAFGISEDQRSSRAPGGRRLILLDCAPATLKVFRIGADARRSFACCPMPGQVSTHCSGASGGPPSAILFLEFIRLVRRQSVTLPQLHGESRKSRWINPMELGHRARHRSRANNALIDGRSA
jgi:hypothetical protein